MARTTTVIEFNLATNGPRVWAPFSGFPQHLDPRFDYARADEDLERVHLQRLGLVAAEARYLSDGRAIEPKLVTVALAGPVDNTNGLV